MQLPGESSARRERRHWDSWRWLGLALVLVIVALLWQLRAWLVSGNVHAVIEGEVYRSAQRSAEQLGELSDRYALRSIVNLRGDQHELTWYPAERQVASERDLDYHSLRLSGDRLPSPEKLALLLEILEQAERPTLIHCLRGTDRSGLASALTLLLESSDLARARQEFSISHGYLAAVSPSDLRQLLDLYEAWLSDNGLRHSAQQLHRFAREGYTPYFFDAIIEALDVPETVQADVVNTFSFRVTNTSPQPWKVTPYPEQGVHLALSIEPIDQVDSTILWHRGDTPEQEIAPGESLEVPVRLRAFAVPGRYRVRVDMVEEWVTMFADMGSQPLEFEIEVLAASPEQ